jgi:hypothetical protein
MFNAEINKNEGELDDIQKIKIMNALSEFILLNRHQKPKIFTKTGKINNEPMRENLKQDRGIMKSNTVYFN